MYIPCLLKGVHIYEKIHNIYGGDSGIYLGLLATLLAAPASSQNSVLC